MTEAAAEASDSGSVSGARPGDTLAGGASRTGEHRLSREGSRSVAQRSRRKASRPAHGAVPRFSFAGGAVRVRLGVVPIGAEWSGAK
jgi:hypothetical protein